MGVPLKSVHDPQRAVREQWCAQLPEAQRRLFDSLVNELEASYNMLSISLDEAFAQRSRGRLVRAREGAAVAAELFDRLSLGLLAALGAVGEQSQQAGRLPDVTPLNPEFFRCDWAQRAAAWNHLVHLVLRGARSRFQHKLRVLDGTVENLAGEFREAAQEISEGASVRPAIHWQSLDSMHYDVNTCLRETIVLLKSFLHLLPADHLDAFARCLAGRKRDSLPAGSQLAEPTRRKVSRAWT